MVEEIDIEVGITVRYKGMLCRVDRSVYGSGIRFVDLRKFDGRQGIVKKKVPLSDIDLFPSQEEIRSQCDAILEQETAKGLRHRYNKARNIPTSHDPGVDVTRVELPMDLRSQWKD